MANLFKDLPHLVGAITNSKYAGVRVNQCRIEGTPGHVR